MKTYDELANFKTFEERFNYLYLGTRIGDATFGFDRYLNQIFYNSSKWKSTRNKVIIRDGGCDLGVQGHEIFDRIYIHHMNPITILDIENDDPRIYDLNFLISVSFETHNAIHYGRKRRANNTPQILIERTPYDTCPWRKGR